MAYSAKSQKKYNDKCYRFSIKFVPSEAEDIDRFKSYLANTGQSANSYIKGLIKADLDSKGIEYVMEETDNDRDNMNKKDNE